MELLKSLTSIAGWKALGMAALAALATVAAYVVRVGFLKRARNKAQQRANIAEAQLHVNTVNKQIARKEKQALDKRLSKAKEQSSTLKEGTNGTISDDFAGVDALNNPNDGWRK